MRRGVKSVPTLRFHVCRAYATPPAPVSHGTVFSLQRSGSLCGQADTVDMGVRKTPAGRLR